MNQGSKKKVSVSMPPELYEQLKILAKENCYTLPGYIRQILKVGYPLRWVSEIQN